MKKTSPSSFKTLIILNPKSSGGKTRLIETRLDSLLKTHLPFAEQVWTTHPGEATDLTRRALKTGYQMIVAGGGDGTLNEVLNGCFEGQHLIREEAVLGILPLGSGKDFLRTLGWKPLLKPSIERLRGTATMPCDVGLLHYRSADGSTAQRYFINIADVGLAYDVMKKVNTFPKMMGTKLSYLQGVARAFLSYKKRYVDLIIDDHHKGSHVITNIFIGNGRSNGGGWRFCPDAQLDDGVFDILVVGDVSAASFIRALPHLYRGEKVDHPALKRYRGAHIRILPAEPDSVGVEADGEPLGCLPADFHNLHHKIRLKV